MKCNEYNTKSGKPIRLWQGDCMELMEGKPENYWDLSIVDPPYGIDAGNMNLGFSKSSEIKKSQWDSNTPNKKYFNRLLSISKNQIIWGANYFSLPPTKCHIVWDKGPSMKDRSFSEAELAWGSFDSNIKIKELCAIQNNPNKIHKTQKPIKLYRWLLTNYAEEGDTILDTHGGSMSLAIACYMEDYELDIIELDEDYYNDAVDRFEGHISQQTLF